MANGEGDAKVKRPKKVTFVMSVDGDIKIGQHETNAYSVESAFDEFKAANGGAENVSLVGAIPGHHSFMKDHIRKPTYAELEAMVQSK